LNKKIFKQKMSYAKKITITLFSGCSALYVGSQFSGSNMLMCVIVIFVIGIFAGNVFWSMLWYLLNESKKEIYDIVQESESFDGILLFLACIASILHAIMLRIVLYKQFAKIPYLPSIRARPSPPAGITFVEFFLFILIFCGVIKLFLREKKEISYRDF
jgi:hypothetical protein